MLGSLVDQLAVLAMSGLLVWAAATDALKMTIPNRIVLGIVALYPAWLLTQHGTAYPLLALLIALGVLAAGFAAFSFGVVGGGDAKLLAAVSLWAGPQHAAATLAIVAILGGGLAVLCYLAILVRRRLSPARGGAAEAEIPISQQSIPYGVAIALGGLYVALRLLTG
jgi:prepilin peptidase CpaA